MVRFATWSQFKTSKPSEGYLQLNCWRLDIQAADEQENGYRVAQFLTKVSNRSV